jgi:hypothetical protein
MKRLRFPLFALVAGAFVLISGTPVADGQLHWSLRKEPIQFRLIALAVSYPRSSFFSNDEVFVAEQELANQESRFIKVVYDFLPYQSPLSSYGLNYSLLHVVRAVRDTSCDESLWQMRTLKPTPRRSITDGMRWRYAQYSPIADLDFRQARLRCYRTTSDDYEKSLREPTNEIPY